MSEENYVFAVFAYYGEAAQCISALHQANFKEADINLVGKDCSEFKRISARINNPNKKYFVWFGSLGALGGLYAGPILAPHLPYVVSFQIITTIMATVSSSIILAYMGQFLAAFLHANEPQHYANVYEGEVLAGQALVSISAKTAEECLTAWKIMDAHGALETISRRALSGPIIGQEDQESRSFSMAA